MKPFPENPIERINESINREKRFIDSKGDMITAIIGSNIIAHNFNKMPRLISLTRMFSGDAYISAFDENTLTIQSTGNGSIFWEVKI